MDRSTRLSRVRGAVLRIVATALGVAPSVIVASMSAALVAASATAGLVVAGGGPDERRSRDPLGWAIAAGLVGALGDPPPRTEEEALVLAVAAFVPEPTACDALSTVRLSRAGPARSMPELRGAIAACLDVLEDAPFPNFGTVDVAGLAPWETLDRLAKGDLLDEEEKARAEAALGAFAVAQRAALPARAPLGPWWPRENVMGCGKGPPPADIVLRAVPDERARELVERVVHRRAHVIRYCHEVRLLQAADAVRSFRFALAVDALGRPGEVRLLGGVRDEALRTCLRNQLAAWQFPALRRAGRVVVSVETRHR